MSSCRCNEIKKYTTYKETLETNMSELQTCDDMLVNISDNLAMLKEKVGVAYYANNISTTVNRIGNLDADMFKLKGRFQGKMNTRMEEIKSILSQLSEEDAEFHEEEKLVTFAGEE